MTPQPSLVLERLIVLKNTALYQPLATLAREKRMILFAGLPGVGKSLFLQQMALLAHEAGRTIHLLQWDVTRAAFETPTILARYPEVDGVTHAAVRKAVGLWARRAIYDWHTAHPADTHILIGEVPLIGNRLIELVQPLMDEGEALLASNQTTFVLPVPTRAVRQVIEAARAESTANPQHEKETADAMPHILQMLWEELYRVAQLLARTETGSDFFFNDTYYTEIYTAVYQHLLQHRHTNLLSVAQVLAKVGSVYDLPMPVHELVANNEEVTEALALVAARYDEARLQAAVATWYQVSG